MTEHPSGQAPWLRELSEQLALGCRILADQQVLDSHGHLSARVPGRGDQFVISRGVSPSLARPEDFIVMDFDGRIVQGDGYPNAEWPIHASAYAAREDAQSVLHSHSRWSRVFSISEAKLRGVVNELLVYMPGDWDVGVPVYQQAGLVNTRARGDALAQVLGSGAAALLRGHGDLIAGPDVTTVVTWGVMLRENAEVLHLALAQGAARYWTTEELAEWQGPQRDQVGPEAAAALARRRWDYLEARVTGRWREHVYGGHPRPSHE